MKDKRLAGLQIVLTDEADECFRRYLHTQIKAYNDQNSAHHQDVRSTGSKPLDILVKDAAGRMLGGLTASTYWGWLDIDDLWLEEALRRKGIGRALLQRAEEEARSRDCALAKVTTFSFQARTFYEKSGYVVVGELKDYPPGESLYWMRKEL